MTRQSAAAARMMAWRYGLPAALAVWRRTSVTAAYRKCAAWAGLCATRSKAITRRRWRENSLEHPSNMDPREYIRQLFRSTLVRYAHQKLSAETQVEYQADWLHLAESVGIERFEQALTTARMHCAYIPQAADLHPYMPPPELGRPSRHDPNCALCGGSGFVRVPVLPGERNARYKRCTGVDVSA